MSVRRRALSVLVLASALLAAALVAAAASSVTFMVTRGASMQPSLSAGDLAILRPVGKYDVGDVAGYRNQALDRVVLHRIVGIDGDVVTFKGDANAFLDPERVPLDDVVGGLSLRIPWVGSALLWLLRPFNLILLTTAVGLAASRLRRSPAPAARSELDSERIVAIQDMSFPHELAVADVADVQSLLELAEHYDRPILHEEAHGLLFMVEGSMLYRCSTTKPALRVVSHEPDRGWQRKDGRRPTLRGPAWDYGRRETS